MALHHPDPLAVGTNPRWAVTHSPFVFRETFRAYLKAAGTTVAKWHLPAAAMAAVFAETAAAI